MCWNIEVSLLAAVGHLITLYIVHKSKISNPFIREGYIRFLIFYMIMEIFQASQWITASPVPFSALPNEQSSCSQWNQITTVFAYILIWYQPYLFSRIAKHRSSDPLHIACLFTFFIAMLQISVPFIREYFDEECKSEIKLPNTNYHHTTCTYIGKYGHLDWKFNILNIAYYPTHFGYFLLVGTIILKLHPIHKWTIGIGWLLSLLITLFLVGFGPELPSYWCVLSIIASPIIIGYIILTKRFRY